MLSTRFCAIYLLLTVTPYIPQKYMLYHSPPKAVRQDPQELRGCRVGWQWAISKAAQERGVFAPEGAGKAVDAADNISERHLWTHMDPGIALKTERDRWFEEITRRT